MWWTKLRSRKDSPNWWEITSEGKRYGVLRAAKNRTSEGSGKYGVRAVAERTGMMAKKIQEIELGVGAERSVIETLVADLGMPIDVFLSGEKPGGTKKAAPPSPSSLNTAKQGPPVKKPPEPKPEIPVQSKKSDNAPKEFMFVNHTLDSFIVAVQGNEIHILEPTEKNLKRGAYILPADDIAGTRIVARTTKVRG